MNDTNIEENKILYNNITKSIKENLGIVEPNDNNHPPTEIVGLRKLKLREKFSVTWDHIKLWDKQRSVKEQYKYLVKNEELLPGMYHIRYMTERLEFREKLWTSIGFVAIAFSILFALISFYTSLCSQGYDLLFFKKWFNKDDIDFAACVINPHINPHVIWTSLIKGVLLAGIPAAFATYSFGLSKAYIHERLKRFERKQGIAISDLYLSMKDDGTLGDMSVEDFMRVFQWNFVNETAFSKNQPPIHDPITKSIVSSVIKEEKGGDGSSIP